MAQLSAPGELYSTALELLIERKVEAALAGIDTPIHRQREARHSFADHATLAGSAQSTPRGAGAPQQADASRNGAENGAGHGGLERDLELIKLGLQLEDLRGSNGTRQPQPMPAEMPVQPNLAAAHMDLRSNFDGLSKDVLEVRRHLDDLAKNELRMALVIQKQVQDFKDQIVTLRTDRQEFDELKGIAGAVELLAERIGVTEGELQSRMRIDVAETAIQQINSDIDGVRASIDASDAQHTASQERIERLSNVVLALGKEFEATSKPSEIEEALKDLVGRVDTAEQGFEHIEKVKGQLSDLTDTLESLRFATVDVAQRVAREIVEEALSAEETDSPEEAPVDLSAISGPDFGEPDLASDPFHGADTFDAEAGDPIEDAAYAGSGTDHAEPGTAHDPGAGTANSGATTGLNGAVPIVPAGERRVAHDDVPDSIMNILTKNRHSAPIDHDREPPMGEDEFERSSAAVDQEPANAQLQKILDRIVGRLK